MKKLCCSALFHALIEHRYGLEWRTNLVGCIADTSDFIEEISVEDPIVVGMFCESAYLFGEDGRRGSKGFLPLHWCPYCGAEI